MSELAFNINGEAFDLPATATGWRVRRMKQRGAPEVVYGKDGVPLIVPAEAGLEELRQVVGTPGRYRLDAIDERSRTIEDLPASYVIVPSRESDAQAVTPDVRSFDGSAATMMAEAMRLNTELAKTVIERFPQMVEAAASLLRAADGAGLPAREPRAVVVDDDSDDEDDDRDESEERPGFDLNALVAQLVPMLMMNLGSGKLKLPGLGELLDWRKAGPKTSTPRAKAPALSEPVQDDAPESDAAASAADVLPPITPTTMAHFIAVQSALKPEEAALAREVAGDLPPAELRAWFDELTKLSVPDAVAKIRTLIGKGGAS